MFTAIAVIVAGMIAIFALGNKPESKTVAKGDVVSEKGIHWHPILDIYIKGQKQEIPHNIGIGSQYANSKWYDSMMSMTDVHTHEDNDGKLHWEVMDNMAPVTKDHVYLGVFFEIWGITFNSHQIFDRTNGPDGTVKFIVNGNPNSEFENYIVHDGDKIEIRYE